MSDPRSKLMTGLLEALILNQLEREPSYGYGLLKTMEGLFGAEPNRNRVYPLLQRMERDGILVRTASEADDEGRPRQDYSLTPKGRDRLAEYRAMPESFRDGISGLWGAIPDRVPGSADAPSSSSTDSLASRAPARETTEDATAPAPAGIRIPLSAPGTAPLPYPCPDARVGIEKNPRNGDLAIRLTGCPMGAYDYCPKCPIWKATEGYRHLTFG